jgi:molecular chaperone DnaK (HSP70)
MADNIVGIDLGTTHSLIATVDSGIPYVIADATGQRLTPSVVHLGGADVPPLVGFPARRMRAARPSDTIYSVKRFMGRRGSDIPREEMLVTYPVRGSDSGGVTFDVNGRAWTPEEISAEILKKLKADAEGALGGSIARAVITVPAYFNDAQRNATKRAGELAGFTVERILNEPTAAALAYGLNRLRDHARIAVYDLGGGTFDLSILELNKGVFQVLATHGDTRLGGDDLDTRLTEFVATKIHEAGGPDLRGRVNAGSPLRECDVRNAERGSTLTPTHFPQMGEGGQIPQWQSRDEAGDGPSPVQGNEARSFRDVEGTHEPHDASPGAAGSGGAAPDPVTRLQWISRIREAAEQAKIQLSSEPVVEIALPFLTPTFSFSLRLSRAELEALTRDIVMRTRVHCLRALSDAKLVPKDLDQVILVGGQTRMPLVRELVADWFQCAQFEETRGDIRLGTEHHRAPGPLLNTGINPDEAVALGAAIQAEILAGGLSNLLLLDVTPLSLGLETFGGLMNVIIPRNTTIPVKAGEVFTTAVDRQRSMLIHVLQGERERAPDNWSLGRFEIEFEPAPKGVPRVGVQFEIDANGLLHVLARDMKTGRQTIVEMKSAVDVSDAEVQKMIEESVEHAFDDLKARQWVEAKLRAGETLSATRQGLAEMGHELETAYRQRVEDAMRALEAALETEDPASRTGDVARLKSTNEALDAATQHLAELMMDKAMEAMLRRQGLLSGK